MNSKIALCPVCGYDGFDHVPENYDICPSCLLEFGVSDTDWTYDELRRDWIAQGAKWAWGNEKMSPPPRWSALRQLCNIGYRITENERKALDQNQKTTPELVRYPQLQKL